jgi:predicted dehydrogenase
LIQRSGDVLVPRIDFGEPLRAECQHFADCLIEGRKPITDGENGLRGGQSPRGGFPLARRGRDQRSDPLTGRDGKSV